MIIITCTLIIILIRITLLRVNMNKCWEFIMIKNYRSKNVYECVNKASRMCASVLNNVKNVDNSVLNYLNVL